MFKRFKNATTGRVVSGPHTMSFPWKYRAVSAGCEIVGCQTSIAEPDDSGNGEVSSAFVTYSLKTRSDYTQYIDLLVCTWYLHLSFFSLPKAVTSEYCMLFQHAITV